MARPHRIAAFGAAGALALLALALSSCGDDTWTPPPPVAADDGQYGSIPETDEFNLAAIALPVEALRVPPAPLPPGMRKILQNTPAVSQQGTAKAPGSPGTCEAQSFGYGLGSYTAARNPDGSTKWDAALPANEVSAAFQFALAMNQGFASCPKGGKALVYLSRLTAVGSPTVADVGYMPDCSYLEKIDVARTYAAASRMRIGSFATISVAQPDALDLIKGYLANDQAIAFSGPVYKGYASSLALTNGVFYDVPANLIPDSGHGQLIVGFDDTLGSSTKPGALLIQNSFGTDWPPAAAGSIAPAGKLWWSYETFLKSQKLMAVAYPHDPTPPSGTFLAPSVMTAPAAAIERAWQWAPVAGGAVYFIFMHHLADPVRLMSVTVKEPVTGKETVTGQYGQYLSKGYTYFRRADGNAFLAGTYAVRVDAVLLDGTAVTYSGNVEVGAPAPYAPAAASMQAAAGKLFDSTGKAVPVAVGGQ